MDEFEVFNTPWAKTPGQARFLEKLGELALMSGRFEFRLTELVLILDKMVEHEKTSAPNDVTKKLKVVGQLLEKIGQPHLVSRFLEINSLYARSKEAWHSFVHGLTTVVPVSPDKVVFQIRRFERGNNFYNKSSQKLIMGDLLDAISDFQSAVQLVETTINELK